MSRHPCCPTLILCPWYFIDKSRMPRHALVSFVTSRQFKTSEVESSPSSRRKKNVPLAICSRHSVNQLTPISIALQPKQSSLAHQGVQKSTVRIQQYTFASWTVGFPLLEILGLHVPSVTWITYLWSAALWCFSRSHDMNTSFLPPTPLSLQQVIEILHASGACKDLKA